MSKFQFFVGIDVSKATIDVAFHDGDKTIYLDHFKNSEKGFDVMLRQLETKTNHSKTSWFFCFENTGSYSKKLLYHLTHLDFACREENPIAIYRSLGLRRGKDDKVDSIDICNYAFEKRDRISPSLLDKPFVVNLKVILSSRDLLVRQRAALKKAIKPHKDLLDPELYQNLEGQYASLIEEYNLQIRQLEKDIAALIKSDVRASKNDMLLQSIVGIAHITSAYIISTTNNFEKFNNARKFACYCGVAPFPNSSGIRKGKMTVSHLANKKVKSILSNGVQVAIIHDPQIAHYYQRKLEEGKRKGIVLNAIKNKIIHRVFSVIKRQTPYVKLNSYAH